MAAADSKTPAAKPILEIDVRFASFTLERKPDEINDKNFPPHLHAACQLFCMTNNIAQAKQLHDDVSAFLAILEKPPDGRTTARICIALTQSSCSLKIICHTVILRF